ncbi:Perilipin-3 [Chelonia mydas]|uniref:Perilipin-3 n=1 Tax=Chelonia mydas TaxID=8469 RepID=M7AMI6_CHEMY|nr:Perilipin-3 [Chelonia mydas]
MPSAEAWGWQTNATCESSTDMELVLHYSLIPSFAIILVLSFLERRVSRSQIDGKLHLLNGRFGIVIPLDFVGTFSNRWSFGFAFGATANKVMFLFSEGYRPLQVPQWAQAIVLLIGSTEVGLSYFPFFACLSTEFRITGSVLGFFYTFTWQVRKSWFQRKVYECMPSGREDWVRKVRWVVFMEREGTMLEQVRKSWFQRKVYEWDPCFQFPGRMIGTSALALICLYIFIVIEFYIYKQFSQELKILDQRFEELVDSSNGSEVLVPAVLQLKEFINVTEGYLIIHVVQCLFGVMIMYSFVLPIQHGQGLEVAKGLGIGILTVGIATGLMILQIKIAARFFLQPKILPDDKRKPLALNNRKAFHNFNYFLFFYNVLLGLGACLFRLLCSILLGTWLIARIDRTIMQKGYEAADMGTSPSTMSVKEHKPQVEIQAEEQQIKKAVDQKLHNGQDRLYQMWLQCCRGKLEGQEEPDSAKVEAQALATSQSLTQQLKTTCLTLLGSIQGLPSTIQDKAQQVSSSIEELQASFSSASCFQDLSSSALARSREMVTKAQESLDELLDYVMQNIPLDWIVGPFTPAGDSPLCPDELVEEGKKVEA